MLASWVLPGWMSDTQEQLKETLGMVVVVVVVVFFFVFFPPLFFYFGTREKRGRRRRKGCVCLGRKKEEWAVKVQKEGMEECVCMSVCVCVYV